MDIIIHIAIIMGLALLFFMLRWSENPLIYGTIVTISCIGLIISLVSGVYIVEGDIQDYTYQNISNNRVIDTIETTYITEDLGLWKYVFNLSYLGFLIGSIVFWTYSNRREDEF